MICLLEDFECLEDLDNLIDNFDIDVFIAKEKAIKKWNSFFPYKINISMGRYFNGILILGENDLIYNLPYLKDYCEMEVIKSSVMFKTLKDIERGI